MDPLRDASGASVLRWVVSNPLYRLPLTAPGQTDERPRVESTFTFALFSSKPLGDELLINLDTANSESEPVIACGSNGRKLIVWTNQQDPLKVDVRARHLLANGDLDPVAPRVSSSEVGASGNQPAAAGLFDAEFFVMDVQLHHVDLETFGGIRALASLRFLEGNLSVEQRLQNLSQANMIKEVWVDSETAVGIISGVPDGVPMGPDVMAETRDMVNEMSGSNRALMQAMIDPLDPPDGNLPIESMERQVKELGAVAVKTYTGNGTQQQPGWFLDDEDIAYPMFEEAQILGLNAARLYRIDVDETRNAVEVDGVVKIREDLGGMEESRTNYVYGPRTRREFLRYLARANA